MGSMKYFHTHPEPHQGTQGEIDNAIDNEKRVNKKI
jgi:hypothetical protein